MHFGGRSWKPEKIAATIAFLASNDALLYHRPTDVCGKWTAPAQVRHVNHGAGSTWPYNKIKRDKENLRCRRGAAVVFGASLKTSIRNPLKIPVLCREALTVVLLNISSLVSRLEIKTFATPIVNYLMRARGRSMYSPALISAVPQLAE